jgi:hypothetical protein
MSKKDSTVAPPSAENTYIASVARLYQSVAGVITQAEVSGCDESPNLAMSLKLLADELVQLILLK